MLETPLIEWLPRHMVGVPILDEQHRGAVSIINSFAYSLLHDNTEFIINSTFSMMDVYTKVHFWTEEALLERALYPELEGHRKIHKALIRESFTVASESLRLADPGIYLQFLKRWWMNHINEVDRQYAEFLQKAVHGVA